jgi:hypothetical protein
MYGKKSKWRRWAAAICSAALGAAALGSQAAHAGEVTTTTDRSFLVTYPDGSKETVLVRYEAILGNNVWQRGSAAKPLKGKFVDDRRCEWSITARVQARPYLVSRSGVAAPLTDAVVVADNVHLDGRGPTNDFQAAGFYHSTCGDKRSTIDGQVNATRQALLASFHGHVEADSTRIASTLKHLLKPVEVARS